MVTLQLQNWERHLVAQAYQAQRSSTLPPARQQTDRRLLNRAYALCDGVTAEHSKTFYAATSLLPREKCRAVRALYAFCRVSDDSVDCGKGDAENSLAAWRRRALSAQLSTDALYWAETPSEVNSARFNAVIQQNLIPIPPPSPFPHD